MAKKPDNTRKLAADKIVLLPLAEIRPYDKNPRKNEKAVKYVKESIRQFGFKVPIVIDSNRVIVCGHTRLLAAKSLGMTEVPCIMADDLTDDQVKAFRLADNKVGEFAEWDMDLLGDELDAIADASDIDMEALGFDLSGDDEETEIVEDEVPEEVEPVCKKGDIWLLGEHRLMCGDSTAADAVAKLMNGEQADLWLTDPPYNVDYNQKYNDMLDAGVGSPNSIRHEDISNDKMSDADFDNFLLNAFSAANNVMKAGCSFYVWTAQGHILTQFASALDKVGLEFRQQIIWRKNTFVPGRSDYQWIHEPCFYGWKAGAAHYFTKHRDRSTVYSDGEEIDIDKMKKDEMKILLHEILDNRTPISVIDCQKPARSEYHPTMKPVRLFCYQIANSSRPSNIILDTFGGSGTTMIACEQLGRKCRMMELDPHYCDVIIARWEKLTGQKAVKVEA